MTVKVKAVVPPVPSGRVADNAPIAIDVATGAAIAPYTALIPAMSLMSRSRFAGPAEGPITAAGSVPAAA